MAMDRNAKQVLLLPFPAQGHITPMIQFSKRLVSKGVKVTLISAFVKPAWIRAADNIPVENISAEAPEPDRDLSNTDDFYDRLRRLVREKLPGVAAKHAATYLVYDSILPWTLDVAAQLGMRAAPLFTQPWCVNAILYSLRLGLLKLPLEADLPVSVAPAYPMTLELRDFPSFLYDSKQFPTMLGFLTDQFSNLDGADCVLCNTFDALEEDVLRWVSRLWTVRNVGPTLPLLSNDHAEDDSDTLMEWLKSKEEGSVVYMAFGTVAEVGEEQLKEIALGVANCGFLYVWALRETEAKKLPAELMTRMAEEERGLVVNWCNQRRVLSDKAVGCFLSHCGWNSTLEAVCSGVPVVGVPLWSDQTTNAKFVSDVWGFGLRPKPNDDTGLVVAHRIERCIKEVMTEGETRHHVIGNSLKWKKLAEDAISEGGTSDANILQFVANL